MRIAIATFITVGFLVSCEMLQPVPPTDPQVPPQPGETLARAVESAGVEDAVGAASLLVPGVAPYAGLGILLWRLVRKHRAGVSVARSVQDLVDALPAEDADALNQTPAAKKLIRQARGKSLNVPL